MTTRDRARTSSAHSISPQPDSGDRQPAASTPATRPADPPQAEPTHWRVHELLDPRSIAVIGATETQNSVGRAVMENLRVFPRPVFPVHPTRATVLGLPAVARVTDIAEPVDLAVIAVPAAAVPDVIRDCNAKRVRGAIVITAGFGECGAHGASLEAQITAEARRTGLRLIGPNCLGVMLPHRRLNATFAAAMARPGNVGFISQSGALCTAILDWSLRENVGFSAFISVGAMADVGWGDVIDFLGDDPHTRSIVMYMESVGGARGFLSAARAVAFHKPIIALKVGRTQAAAQAAASHTGSLTGSDDVLDAAFRRVGILRVDTIEELFDMAEALGKQPRPRGPRLAVVTNAGGPGALAADRLVLQGGQLAALSDASRAALDQLLPPHWSHGNPIDLLGDAAPDRYFKSLELLRDDPNNDGVLVILTPQAMTDATGTAQRVAALSPHPIKPILASWMGGEGVEAGRRVLNQARIPTFDYPDTAARVFERMWSYSTTLRALYETPSLNLPDSAAHNAAAADTLIARARSQGRTLLTEAESKDLLAAYGIDCVRTGVATTPEAAVTLAEQIGFPVAVKLCSETITHKAAVGGVCLDVRSADAVRGAWEHIRSSVTARAGAGHFGGVSVQSMVAPGGYEVILGSKTDPQFGPVLIVGSGGRLVEVYRDRAVGLPPLNATLARRLLEQTKIFNAMQAARELHAVDILALERALLRFSTLVLEQRWIAELDINPLLVRGSETIALDARVILHPGTHHTPRVPRPAIRPYPEQYAAAWRLRDGTQVSARPIRPEDEPLMVTFHSRLSEASVYSRYFAPLRLDQRIDHLRLARVCFADYERELPLVALVPEPPSSTPAIAAVGRINRVPGTSEAEFALLVADAWQGRGLGARLLNHLLDVARQEQITCLRGLILAANQRMLQLVSKAGFRLERTDGSAECVAVRRLGPARGRADATAAGGPPQR